MQRELGQNIYLVSYGGGRGGEEEKEGRKKREMQKLSLQKKQREKDRETGEEVGVPLVSVEVVEVGGGWEWAELIS